MYAIRCIYVQNSNVNRAGVVVDFGLLMFLLLRSASTLNSVCVNAFCFCVPFSLDNLILCIAASVVGAVAIMYGVY